MSNGVVKRLVVVLASAAIAACGSSGLDIGPTIADLDEPIKFRSIGEVDGFHVEVEPAATFEVDRQQVIDSFRKLASITAQGGGSGDEMRRLADLELEASLDNRISDDEITRLQGIRESLHAIGTYQAYLRKYPDREDNDLILYQLSRAYALESLPGESIDALDRIASKFPDSKYMDEVQFRRGEYLFVERDFEGSEAAYGVVVADYPDSLFFEKALYKYGWTQFKQGKHVPARASYVRLLDVNLENGNIEEAGFSPELSRADLELLNDAVRVLCLSFSYEDDRQYISSYFGENGKRDYEPLVYLEMSELYLEKNRIIDAADLMLVYTREYPFSPHTSVFHQRVIETYRNAGYVDLLLAEKTVFANRYDVNSEYWLLQEPETRQGLTENLVAHMRDLATHFHAQARKSGKTGDYDVAADWYRRFLKSFPEHTDAPRMNFLLAESLYDAGRYAQAIDEYQKTAYQYQTHQDSAEAGYAALVSFDALFKSSNADDLAELRNKRIRSAERFTTTYSDDPRLSVVELQTAQQYYEWHQYPAAMTSARRLTENDQVDKTTRAAAWTILSNAQFSTQDYAAAEKSYLTLLGLMPPQASEREAVQEQVAASIYKQGERARETGDHLLAARHFGRLGQIVPESPSRIVADYDAAAAYIQLEDWPASISHLEKFRQRYPHDQKFSGGVTEKLALAYSKSGDQPQAAREMLALSKLPGTPERKRDLMWRAAELYRESGRSAQAIAVYKNYVEDFPYPLERSMELRHKIAESYRSADDGKNLRFWLNEIVRADNVAKSKSNARSKYLAAIASLELLRPLHRSYKNTKLSVPLKTSLRKKKKLMQKSIDAYKKAMNYQVREVTTEATFQIAEIYHDFAKSLINSQRPKGLDEEQLEEYELLLEEQAFPFEEKAIDIHLANFKRIPGGIYDEPTRNSLRVLGELMPFRFARAELTDAYVEIQ